MSERTSTRSRASDEARYGRGASPSELMRVLADDLHQVRVGNGMPEQVPVFADPKEPGVRYVRFSDLSVNVRRILDICPEVEIRVDGAKHTGARGWREVDGWRSPVLQWENGGLRR